MRGLSLSPAPRPAVIALGLAAALLTVAAAGMMFSTFMLYDDEGYVLLSLKNFAEHGGLYRDVYSQYGPFPYALYSTLHALGLPLTHMAGRLLTLAAWAGAALSTTVIVWRVARDFATTLAVLASTFVYLWIMVSEPAHPGGLITLLTAVLAAFGAARLMAVRDDAWAAATGAGVAALLVTKINVGVFAALSFGALWVLYHRNERLRRAAPWVLAAGFALLPFALMRPLLDAPWVRTYAVMFALSGAAAAGAAGLGGTARFGARQLWIAALSGGAVLLAVFGCVLARGSSPGDLLEGMLLGPLRHPVNFSLKYPWPPGVLSAAVVSAGLFCIARARPGRMHAAVAVLRLAAAGGLAAQILKFPLASPDMGVFSFALPTLWLFLWPLPGGAAGPARAWPALLFLGQSLHAFPVPGSQIAWGTFLAVPVGAAGAWEAAVWLAGRWPRLRVAAPVLRIALVALALVTGARLAQIGRRALDSRPLGLAGAEQLRLPDSTTATYRLLALNATAHADLLFSLPGMFSFNLWTGLNTPTLANVTHWFSLLNATQQSAIIRVLEAHPRAVVIVQPDHLDFLRQRGFVASGPLYDYVMREFTTAFAIDGFEFRVHRGRRIAPLQTAELLARNAANAAGAPDTLLWLDLLLPPGRAVAGIELGPMDGAPGGARTLSAGPMRLEVTPINLQGDPIGPAAARTLPFTLTGPTRLAIYFDRGTTWLSLSHTLIILRDPTGDELALVRLRP